MKNSLLRGFAVLCLIACAAAPARALTFGGTITETYLGSNFPSFNTYTVGQQWVGWYRYNSPTVDGVFYTNPPIQLVFQPGQGPVAVDLLPRVTGTILGAVGGPLGGNLPDPGAAFSVVNGVIGYSMWYDAGGRFFTITSGSASVWYYDQSVWGDLTGLVINTRLEFSAPTAVSDSGSSVALLGLATMAILALRRRWA